MSTEQFEPLRKPREQARREYAQDRADRARARGDDAHIDLAYALELATGVLCPACQLPHYTIENWRSPEPFPPSNAMNGCLTCRGTGWDPNRPEELPL